MTAPSISFAALIAFAVTTGVGGAANALPEPPMVSYQVSGPGVADYLSYQGDAGMAQRHEANVRLPWSTRFQSFGGQVFVISAQGAGPITCTISIEGKVVSQATANGQPARTVCSH